MGKESKIKEKISYSIYTGLLTGLACLPLPVLYFLSDLAYIVIYHIIGYRRGTVRANLELAFGDTRSADIPDTIRKEDIPAIERRFYHHLCDCIAETVKLLHISDKEIDRRVNVPNGDYIDEIIRSGHPVVLMLGHYGNWEWVQAIIRHFSEPLVGGQIYKPLHSPVMDRVMLKIRSRFGLECIPQDKAVRRLFRIRNDGQYFVIGFISDQRPSGRNAHNWTPFLGHDAPYMAGGEMIGNHTGARFVYLDIEKPARGHYTLTFKPIVPDSQDTGENPYTRTFMKMLEANIYRAPEYWLWSHKRWKWQRPENSPAAEGRQKGKTE